LFLSIVENLNINHSNPTAAADLLKKSYLDKIMVMRTFPVTEAEIINKYKSLKLKTHHAMMKFLAKSYGIVHHK